MDKYVCCICGKAFIGPGNNPWPVNNGVNVKCCDSCNQSVVIPVRIANMNLAKAEKRNINESGEVLYSVKSKSR